VPGNKPWNPPHASDPFRSDNHKWCEMCRKQTEDPHAEGFLFVSTWNADLRFQTLATLCGLNCLAAWTLHTADRRQIALGAKG